MLLAHLAPARMGDVRGALGAGVGVIVGVGVLHLNLLGVLQPQGELIAPDLDLDGVPHGGPLPQSDLRPGGQTHVQQMPAQTALASHHGDHGVLIQFQL